MNTIRGEAVSFRCAVPFFYLYATLLVLAGLGLSGFNALHNSDSMVVFPGFASGCSAGSLWEKPDLNCGMIQEYVSGHSKQEMHHTKP